MMTKLLLAFLLCCPAWAAAALLLCPPTNQTIGTMTADTVATANTVQADGDAVLEFYADSSSVAGTVTNIRCQHSGDGTTWVDVPNAPPGPNTVFAVGAGGKGPICIIPSPVGFYRVTNTTCNATCSIVVKAKCARFN